MKDPHIIIDSFKAIFGWMKSRVYLHDPPNGIIRPRNVEELYTRICEVWQSFPPATLIKIRATYRQSRIDKLLAAGGHRFENLNY